MNNETTVSEYYLDGIREGREYFREHGAGDAVNHIERLRELCRRFSASSPVGQLFRGERDFWKNQQLAKGRK